MSSSNLVRVTAIEETVYGETPGAGDFNTARFTSEALSGSPETTESQQIRADRQSSGQVLTGLTVGGDLNYELAKEDMLDLFFKSAMLSEWDVSAPVSVDLTIAVVAKTLTRVAGDWNGEVEIGDFLTLTGFTNTINNTQVQVAKINTTTELEVIYAQSIAFVDEVGSGTDFQVADKLTVGIVKKSFSMEKTFLDLTEKAINYRGMTVGTMSLTAAFGEIVNGTFGFSGNDYDPVEAAGDFMTDGRTILDPANSQSMNGSVDMPFIANGAVSDYEESSFCIQSVGIELNNNLTPQNCIGKIAPDDYSPGTAQPSVSLSAYLADGNWATLAKKLSQEPFPVGFQIKNVDGWYGFYMPAVQVSFDDPASAGANQDVLLDMSGTAKIGANGESELVIYRS